MLKKFYDRYHKKNSYYEKLIGRNNFTYFYILDFLHEDCMPHIRNQAVLDVGSGVGTLTLYLSQFSKLAIGVDVSERATAIAEQARRALAITNVRFYRGELFSNLPRFNFVLCSEVIEHIEEDGRFLDTIRSTIQSNGYLFLTTPSKENLFYKLNFYKGFDYEVGHYRRYTEKSLTQLLEQHGFVVKKLRKAGGPLRDLLFMTPLGFLIRFIKGPLIPIFHVFDRLLAALFGYSDIQVLAQKKN